MGPSVFLDDESGRGGGDSRTSLHRAPAMAHQQHGRVPSEMARARQDVPDVLPISAHALDVYLVNEYQEEGGSETRLDTLRPERQNMFCVHPGSLSLSYDRHMHH